MKTIRTRLQTLFTAFFLFAFTTTAHAQDVMGEVETFFTDLESIMTTIAASLAVIAFIGLAFMYMGSSLPFLARWKQNNPDAAQNVFIGLGILLFVSGGTVGGMIAF